MRKVAGFLCSITLLSLPLSAQSTGTPESPQALRSIDDLREQSKMLGAVLLCPDEGEALSYCDALSEVLRDNEIQISYMPHSWVSNPPQNDKVMLFFCGIGGNVEFPLASIDDAKVIRDRVFNAQRILASREDEPCSAVSADASEEQFKAVRLWRALGQRSEELRDRIDEICKKPVRPSQCEDRPKSN